MATVSTRVRPPPLLCSQLCRSPTSLNLKASVLPEVHNVLQDLSRPLQAFALSPSLPSVHPQRPPSCSTWHNPAPGPLHRLCPLRHLERLPHLQVVHSFASSALDSDVTSSHQVPISLPCLFSSLALSVTWQGRYFIYSSCVSLVSSTGGEAGSSLSLLGYR